MIPERRDPLYVMISDDDKAIGFKISESGPIKGAEGSAGKYLDPIRLSGKTRVRGFEVNVFRLSFRILVYFCSYENMHPKTYILLI